MKYCVFLVVIATASRFAQAVPLLYSPISTGTSLQYRNQDIVGNYNFGYNEGHATGGTFRREAGDIAGNKVGSYGLMDADGRRRIVNYIADAAGFRATVNTNEPGVDPSKDPAAVAVNKGALLAAPGLGYAAAPLAAGLAYASAPLAAAPYFGGYAL